MFDTLDPTAVHDALLVALDLEPGASLNDLRRAVDALSPADALATLRAVLDLAGLDVDAELAARESDYLLRGEI
ncbi:MAG: hypothetical protein JW751_25445 [Polyangiaceae bacterium]|nr:hypothetical protein [Polyangiaceae bacterium]